MLSIMRRGVVTVLVVLAVAGCTAAPEQPKPPPVVAFTQEMAEAVLAEVVAGVGKNGIADFCAEFARSEETCATLLEGALRECLLPGDKPTVRQAVHESATREYEETWWLVVQAERSTASSTSRISRSFCRRVSRRRHWASTGRVRGLAGV